MRWGLRRRAEARHDVPDLAAQPPARPTVSDWRRVPPLGLTVAARPVLVGATLGSPVVSGTGQLLGRSHKEGERADPARAAAGAEAFRGRVAGLVVPSAPGAADPPKASRTAQPEAGRGSELPPKARLRPAAPTGAAAGQHPVLVKAADEFVGEPHPADTPYASSAWLRMIQAYRRLPTDADAAMPESLPGLSQSGKPDGGTVTTWSSAVALAPPRAARPPAGTDPAAGRPRKLSLAESRRLGVGPPLRRAPGGADDGSPGFPAADWDHEADAADEPGAEVQPGTQQGDFGSSAAEQARAEAGPADTVSGPPPTATSSFGAMGPGHSGRLGLGQPLRDDDIARQDGPADSRLEHAPGRRTADRTDQRRESPSRTTGQRPLDRPRSAQVPRLPQGPRPAAPPSAWTGPPAQLLPPRALPAQSLPPRALPLAPADSTAPGRPPGVRATGGQSASAGGPLHGEPTRQPVHQSGDAAVAVPASAAVVSPVYRAAAAVSHATAVRRAGDGATAEPLVHRSPSGQPEVSQAPSAVAASLAAAAPSPPAETGPPPSPPVVPAPPPPVAAAAPVQSDATVPAAGLPAAGLQRPFAIPFLQPGAATSSVIPPWPGQPSGESQAAAVPYDLADALRRLHGVDVSDVVVDRSPDAADQARAVGARAFTRDGQVALPLAEGPFERPQARALLAHELTHVAQQRAFGSSLPTEDSAYGAALEAQAAAVERSVLGQPTGSELVPLQSLQHAWPAAAAAPRSSPANSLVTVPMQRADPPGTPGGGTAFDPFALLPQQSSAPAPSAESGGAAGQAAAAPEGSKADGEGEGTKKDDKRWLDLDDDQAISELADGIYKQINARLRHELLVGRERSGLLSDFR
jgi:Domain of unknown function (DUF4157)